MPLQRLRIAKDVTLVDYSIIVLFLLFPPIGLHFLMMRRGKLSTRNLKWQEYLFTLSTLLLWLEIFFLVVDKIFYSIFIADTVLFFIIFLSSFMGVSISIENYFSRLLTSIAPTFMAVQLGISTALNQNGIVSIDPCSNEMHQLLLICLAFSLILFLIIPIICCDPSLLEDLIDNEKPTLSVDYVMYNYLIILFIIIILPFIVGGIPNFILIAKCLVF